jgi:hypothetical protein
MIHNGRDRDSLMMPTDSRSIDLMLQYSIHLVRWEPSSHLDIGGGTNTRGTGDGIVHTPFGQFHLDTWRNEEWIAFRDNFVSVLMRYWDGKFELQPNRPWYRPRGAQGAPERASITCSLSIGLVDNPAQANQKYYICKPQEETFRSFAVAEHRLGLFTHRDLSMRWNTRQTPVGHHTRHSVSFLQTVILHEFGHTLGLSHVNGAGNADWNYGTTIETREDLMGMGDHVTSREGRPWISQLRYHLIPERGNRDDAALRFTARVVAPQLITYWDNDWVPPPATPPHATP